MRARDHLRLLAEYNRWMNDRLFALVATLTDEERTRDMGAFFGSIQRTLDHVYWADRAWAIRWLGWPGEIGPLGAPLFADFEALRRERARLDQAYLTWASEIDEAALDEPYTVKSVAYGKERTLPRWMFVVQIFNHQTHHRGQVTTLLKQLGHDPGITDLPWMPYLDAPPAP